MSHTMAPDGVLPIWLWVPGRAGTAAPVALIAVRARRGNMVQQMPLIGVMAALMTVAMSFARVPIAYEPRLAVPSTLLLVTTTPYPRITALPNRLLPALVAECLLMT